MENIRYKFFARSVSEKNNFENLSFACTKFFKFYSWPCKALNEKILLYIFDSSWGVHLGWARTRSTISLSLNRLDELLRFFETRFSRKKKRCLSGKNFIRHFQLIFAWKITRWSVNHAMRDTIECKYKTSIYEKARGKFETRTIDQLLCLWE